MIQLTRLRLVFFTRRTLTLPPAAHPGGRRLFKVWQIDAAGRLALFDLAYARAHQRHKFQLKAPIKSIALFGWHPARP